MEKALEKLIKKLIQDKFPEYFDVKVDFIQHPVTQKECYRIYLLINRSDIKKMSLPQIDDAHKFVNTVAKYLVSNICGVHNYVIDIDEE